MKRKDLRILDFCNYQVNTESGHYYLTDGRRSLKKFCERHGIGRAEVYKKLLIEKQMVLNSETITII